MSITKSPAATPHREADAPATGRRLGAFRKILQVFGPAPYDTPVARQNRRPIQTWTPAGWC